MIFILLRETRPTFGSSFKPGVETEIELVEKFLNPEESIVCFDICANRGEFALAFGRKFPLAVIHAFEPSRTAFQGLQILSGELHTLHPHNNGFSNSVGMINLFGNSLGGELASLHLRDIHRGEDNMPSVELSKFTTLDVWIGAYNIVPNFAKIDTEGNELNILSCAEYLFKNACTIQFEFGGTQIDSRHFFKDYFSLFSNQNYLTLKLVPSGFIPIFDNSADLEDFGYANFLAVPKNNLKLRKMLSKKNARD